MIKNTLLVALSISMVLGSTQVMAHGDKEKDGKGIVSSSEKGFVTLFDGTSTKGWHTYGKDKAGAAWEVQDGALFLNVEGKTRADRGDLVTDKEYENFHLKVEWKISEGGNSGVIFNVHEDPATFRNTYETGPEMQVIDNDKHADAKIHKHRAGDFYDLVASSEEVAKPVGEWNEAEIVLNKGLLKLYLNGVNIVTTTMFDDSWNEIVAQSKFAKWPGFAKYKKGKIALQDHNDAVWFRNIRIKEL